VWVTWVTRWIVIAALVAFGAWVSTAQAASGIQKIRHVVVDVSKLH